MAIMYVEGDPVNMVDASGLCSKVVSSDPGQKTENYYDAIECRSLRDELRTWGVNVVWDELRAIDPYSPENCGQPEAVRAAVEQAQGIAQRFTLGEMTAVHNAFRIFKRARTDIGFENLYTFPLIVPITIEKKQLAGTVDDDQRSALGLTVGRTITMSARWWGEGIREPVQYEGNQNPTRSIDDFISDIRFASPAASLNAMQYRSWLVLHEFGHIFTTDLRVDYRGLYALVPPAYQVQYAPTRYAVSANDEKEFIIEALTGTWWNHGYQAVNRYTSDAGGRTSRIDANFISQAVRDEHNVNGTVITNVGSTFVSDQLGVGQTLEEFIIKNVLSG